MEKKFFGIEAGIVWELIFVQCHRFFFWVMDLQTFINYLKDRVVIAICFSSKSIESTWTILQRRKFCSLRRMRASKSCSNIHIFLILQPMLIYVLNKRINVSSLFVNVLTSSRTGKSTCLRYFVITLTCETKIKG